MKRIPSIVLGIGLLVSLISAEEDNFLITANRIKQDENTVTEKVTVIEKDELQKKGITTLAEALKSLDTVFAPQYGSFGTSSMRLNGASPRNVLVMVDGIALADPTGIDRNFSMTNLMLTGVDRIEVVEGAQSAVYGSNATSGVVNIITDKGNEQLALELSYGSFRSYTGRISLGKRFENVGFYIAGGYSNAEGFNVAPEGTEKDGHYGANVLFKVLYDPTELYHNETGVYYYYDKLDYDDWGRYDAVDADLTQESKRTIAFMKNTVIFDSGIELDINGQYSINERYQRDVERITDTYKGTTASFSTVASWQLFSLFNGRIGFDHSYETAEMALEYGQKLDGRDISVNELFAGFMLTPYTVDEGIVSLNVTGRVVMPAGDNFDTRFVFKSGLTVARTLWPGMTTFSIQYGTGYNLPSLYQLYGQALGTDYSDWPNVTDYIYTAGNPNLQPEKSATFDIALKTDALNDHLHAEIAYGRSTFDDYIKTNYAPVNYEVSYTNSDSAEISNYSASLRFMTVHTETFKHSVYASYVKTIPNSTTGGVDAHLPQVPFYRHKVGSTISYKTASLDVALDTIGDRRAGYPDIILKPYSLLNASLSYIVSTGLSLSVAAQNITDERYSQTVEIVATPYGAMQMITDCDGPVSYPGYDTAPFNITVSLKYTFGSK